MESAARAREGSLTTVLGWTGVGLITGGILLAAVNIVRFDFQDEDWTTPEGAGLWWIAAILGFIVLGVVLARNGEEPDAGRRQRQSWVYTAFLLVTGAVCLWVTYVGFTPDSFIVTAASRLDHQADSAGASMWAVTLSVTFGTLLMAAAGGWPRLQPQSRSMPPAVGGLALVLVIELGLRAATLHQTTEHTVADTFPDAPAPVPTDVSEAGWTWEPPPDTTVVTVEPGPFGPLMLLGDGVVALDGESGEELWSHRHPASETAVDVVDDGARAVVTLFPPEYGFGDRRVTEIDTATGEIVGETTEPAQVAEDEGADEAPRTGPVVATADLRLHWGTSSDEPYRISARSAEADEELWSFQVPDDGDRWCGFQHEMRAGENILLIEDRLVVLYGCADADRAEEWRFPWDMTRDPEESFAAVVAAIDTGTGAVVWEQEWEADEGMFDLVPGRPLSASGARPVVVVDSRLGRGVPRVLEVRDGAPAVDPPSELTESGTEMVEGFERLVHADSGGAVFLVQNDGDRHDTEARPPWEFHRASPDGEIVGTARIPDDSLYPVDVETAAVLDDSVVVLTDMPATDGSDRGEDHPLTVLVAPFGSGVDGTERIDLGDGRPDTGGGGDAGESLAPLVPVPGSVIAYVHGSDPTIIHGLVG